MDPVPGGTAGIAELPGSAAIVEYGCPKGRRVVTTGIVAGAAREKYINAAKKVVWSGVVYARLEHLKGKQPARNRTPGVSKTGVISMGEQCPRPSERRRTAHRLILSGRRRVGPIKAPGSEAVSAVLPG